MFLYGVLHVLQEVKHLLRFSTSEKSQPVCSVVDASPHDKSYCV